MCLSSLLAACFHMMLSSKHIKGSLRQPFSQDFTEEHAPEPLLRLVPLALVLSVCFVGRHPPTKIKQSMGRIKMIMINQLYPPICF